MRGALGHAALGSAGHDVRHRWADPLLVGLLEASDLALARVELLGPRVEAVLSASEVLVAQGGLLEAAFLLDSVGLGGPLEVSEALPLTLLPTDPSPAAGRCGDEGPPQSEEQNRDGSEGDQLKGR